jgi:hypothetical protein
MAVNASALLGGETGYNRSLNQMARLSVGLNTLQLRNTSTLINSFAQGFWDTVGAVGAYITSITESYQTVADITTGGILTHIIGGALNAQGDYYLRITKDGEELEIIVENYPTGNRLLFCAGMDDSGRAAIVQDWLSSSLSPIGGVFQRVTGSAFIIPSNNSLIMMKGQGVKFDTLKVEVKRLGGAEGTLIAKNTGVMYIPDFP